MENSESFSQGGGLPSRDSNQSRNADLSLQRSAVYNTVMDHVH
jgi:hypothetical protein